MPPTEPEGKCPGCGSEVGIEDRFCTECGRELTPQACQECGQTLEQASGFCSACGTPVFAGGKDTKATALDSAIVSIEMALREADPERILQISDACLNAGPTPEQAAIVSVVAMCASARHGDFSQAEARLKSARGFYADHLKLLPHQHDEFVQHGHFIDDLLPIGNRALREHPWSYLILGHNYGPMLPVAYGGATQLECQSTALRAWAEFIGDRHEGTLGALGYLYFSNGQYLEAAGLLERVLLIARRYGQVDPVQIELVWPHLILGDCYWEVGQQQRAAACWRRVLSVESCVPESEIDDWNRQSFPWIAKAKSRVDEHRIPVPSAEASRSASAHLKQAVDFLYEAEEFEEAGADLISLSAMIQNAGTRYRLPLERAALELQTVEHLDPFTWVKVAHKDSISWWCYESAKGFLLQKRALVHISNDNPALAAISYQQAMDVWPMLTACALMGAMQESCGLFKEARATYEMCIERSREFGALEGSDDCKEILGGVREALNELPR